MRADVSPSQRGRLVAWVLVALLIGPLLVSVLLAEWRVPFGTEALGILEDLEGMSLAEMTAVRGSFFRPGFWFLLWSVWGGIDRAGDALFTYKVLHTASIALLVVLFLAALKPRTIIEALCASLAAAILIGTPGFRDNLENLPLNQMLLVMLTAVAAWLVIQRPYAVWHTAVLVTLASLAIGFKEQGLVVAVLIVAGWATGAQGVRRHTAVIVSALVAAYLGFRLLMPVEWQPFGQSVGVGFEELSPEQAIARYGSFPLQIYLYNVAATASNILFSEPTRGVFSITRAVAAGQAQPWQIVYLVSSAVLTLLLAWWLIRVRHRDACEQWAAVALVVAVSCSAALGFNYTRDRFAGVSALFYAGAAFYALRWLVLASHARSVARVAAALAIVATIAGSWNVRAAGTVLGLRESAWAVRREWLVSVPEWKAKRAERPTYLLLIDALAEQGGNPRADAPREPRIITRLFGDW